MPLFANDAFDLPYYASPIRVALEPARCAIQSLVMLTRSHSPASGVADWVVNTQQALTRQERETNDLVLIGLHYAVVPVENWKSFPTYLDYLEAMQPEALVKKMLNVYEQTSHNPGVKEPLIPLQQALASPEAYIDYLRQHFSPENVVEEIEREAYKYVMDPPAMQRLVVEHLRHMWERYLVEEWERVEPTLQSIVQAYSKVDWKGKSFMEAGRLITGHELDANKWRPYFTQARRVTFVPHPHVGPYLPKCFTGNVENREVVVFFGARLPDWIDRDTPDLTRAEIAIRLSALADDTRLRILRHIAEHGEQRSQEIMEALDLSQSATSRHLTQLSTGGFISERRCEGAKCYALNPERITDTLQAIASFLLVQERNGL